MTPPLPQEALERAKSVIDSLHETLGPLFEQIQDGPNSAIRFSAGDNE